MGPPVDRQVREDNRSRRLDSWKEIAVYLKRGERTVRRWEQTEGLPIHRHVHEKAASVYAYSGELDEWVQSRRATDKAETARDSPALPSSPARLRAAIFGVFGILVTLGLVTWIFVPRPSGDEPLRAVPFTSYPGEELDPGFSPDGSQVVFRWNGPLQNNFDIYVKTIGQDNPIRLTRDPAEDFSPVWSPDGRFIAFMRQLSGDEAAVILVPPVGGAEVTLARVYFEHIPGLTRFPWSYLCWHPSSRYLVVSVSEDAPFALHRISLSGERRRLTAPAVTAGPGDLNAAFAPDGKTLAFTRFISGSFGSPIYTLELSPEGEPAGAPQVVSWAATDVVTLAWTADGRELVYQRYGEDTLWRTRAFERSTPRRLFDFAGLQNPAISHDGRSLVFSVGRMDLDIARSEMSTSVGEPRSERVISSTRIDTEATLSPDGRRIVFGSERSGSREIWIAGVDGSVPKQLTNFGHAINGSPSWSHDGKLIAFDSRHDGGRGRIYVVPADEPGLRPVTIDSADNSVPSWSPDGKWLYFSSNRSGRMAIWKASAAHFSEQHQVTTRVGDGPTVSSDGRYLYYVERERVPGPQHLWRLKTSTGEEEAVLPSRNINEWDFFPGNDGVYFTEPPGTNAGRFLYFYDFSSGQVRRAASLPKSYYCCPEVSNDRRYIYYSVMDDLGHDLMIVQNFH